MDFDLTLMISLLRNIGVLVKPSNGWDQLPNTSDTSDAAHLATLKWYRNQLAHTTVSSMDSNEFTDKWALVEKALTSLNKGQTPYEITEILNYDIDGDQAKILANAELQQLKKEYMDCEKEKEQIENDLSYYRDGNIPKNIAVTSKSGSGKTATIRHIAIKLQQKGYEIVPIESPRHIIKFNTNRQQVFLIDDVLGKYDLSPTLLEKWERLNEKLITCLETKLGSSKILCTLRLHIVSQERFQNASTILNKVVFDLEHDSNILSKDEKQKILLKHLSGNNLENKVTANEVEIMCESNYAFPLLCKLVSNDEDRFRKRIAFFKQTLIVVK
ncbi:unnamed protein product [Mytilus coruscus]|uniref:Uncharacterized protein n=1 Tax=Mytilus coruscus TaxID=42192 RepID=A0A6J8DZ28_MYTCO|nr:unnamed protein product [Mytilus coruscus]